MTIHIALKKIVLIFFNVSDIWRGRQLLLEHTVYTKIAMGLSLEPIGLLTALISAFLYFLILSLITLKLISLEFYFGSSITYLLRSTWTCHTTLYCIQVIQNQYEATVILRAAP
jgi:hypothetical protein